MASGLRIGAIVLVALSLGLMLASHVPQVAFSRDSTGGCSIGISMWGEQAGGGCPKGSDFVSWFSSENKGADGIALLRMAGPLLAASTALAALALVFLAMGRPRGGAIVGFVATGMTAATITLTAIGESDFDSGGALDLFLAFYFLCGAALLVAVGSVLAMLERPAPVGAGRRPLAGGPRTFGAPRGAGAPAAPTPPSGGRPGRCPRCKSPVTLFKGVRPSCPTCGFKA